MKNTTTFRSSLSIVIILFTALFSSCNKEKINPDRDARLIGTWSHNNRISSFLTILTQVEFKEDGTGTESIFRITTSGGDTPAVTGLKWATPEGRILKTEYEDGRNDEDLYSVSSTGESFTLTTASGDSKEFFFTE